MTGGLAPEQRARQHIDAQLAEAGWVIQDKDSINFQAAQGVALREVNLGDGRSKGLEH